MTELKPCPFCGNDVKVGIEGFVGSTAVECYHCGAKGPESENPSRAEIAWNRRIQPEATKDDSLRTSLADLATALWRTHYRNDSPNFELLPDAAGILSQIDNMASGLVKPEATKPAQDLDAAIPDGWQLVPKEPTKEMLTKMATSCTCEECLTRHYKWMLDAAS